jgi:hypothetical protein
MVHLTLFGHSLRSWLQVRHKKQLPDLKIFSVLFSGEEEVKAVQMVRLCALPIPIPIPGRRFRFHVVRRIGLGFFIDHHIQLVFLHLNVLIGVQQMVINFWVEVVRVIVRGRFIRTNFVTKCLFIHSTFEPQAAGIRVFTAFPLKIQLTWLLYLETAAIEIVEIFLRKPKTLKFIKNKHLY